MAAAKATLALMLGSDLPLTNMVALRKLSLLRSNLLLVDMAAAKAILSFMLGSDLPLANMAAARELSLIAGSDLLLANMAAAKATLSLTLGSDLLQSSLNDLTPIKWQEIRHPR